MTYSSTTLNDDAFINYYHNFLKWLCKRRLDSGETPDTIKTNKPIYWENNMMCPCTKETVNGFPDIRF